MLIQILGWCGTALFVYGVWIIGNKNVTGFYANSIANLCYAWQSIYLGNHPLFWLSILLIIINLKCVYQWQFQSKKSKLRKLYKKAQRNAKQINIKYQCPICGRSQFDRNYQPHICNGTFRKKLPLFKKLIQDAGQKYNSELMKFIDREDR